MPDLTPEQIKALAESIALHSSGATGGTGHLLDFPDANSTGDLVKKITEMLDNNPATKFIVNESNDPLKGGSVIFFNKETQSVLVFNPNQLGNVSINSQADNLAGTFYRSPRLKVDPDINNGDPFPISKRSGRKLKAREAVKEFEGAVKSLKSQIIRANNVDTLKAKLENSGVNIDYKKLDAAKITGAETAEELTKKLNTVGVDLNNVDLDKVILTDAEKVTVHNLAEKFPDLDNPRSIVDSPEWSNRISKHEKQIREGLPKAKASIQKGVYDKPGTAGVIADTKLSGVSDVMGDMKTTMLENIDNIEITTDSDGRLSIIPSAENADKYQIQIAPDGKTAELRIAKPNGALEVVPLDEKGLSALDDVLKSDEIAKLGVPSLDKIMPVIVEGKPLNPEFGHPEFKLNNQFNGKANSGIDAPKLSDGLLDAGKQADALKKMNVLSELVDAARGVKTLKGAMKAAKGLSKGAKLTLVGGAVVTGGVAILISKAHASQRDLADKLHENSDLSDEALKEYKELNNQIEKEMQAENIGAQGPVWLLTTPALEYAAMKRFEGFSAKHGLSPAVHDALGMSLFDGKSLSAEFAEEAIDIIPEKMADMDPEHHQLWRATQDLEDADSASSSAKWAVAFAPRVSSRREGITAVSPEELQRLKDAEQAAQERFNQVKLTHAVEFSRVLNDPEAGDKLLSMMDKDVLMDMVDQTAKHHYEGQDPLIKKLADAQEAYDNAPYGRDNIGIRYLRSRQLNEVKQEIRDNPQVLHGYIRDVFGNDGSTFANPENALDQNKLTETQNIVEDMPDFVQNRTIEAVAVSINTSGETKGVHPYLRDIAALYKSRDNQYASSSRREDLNEKIEELKTEILKNPEILAEYAQGSPEVQAVVNDYTNRKEELDSFADVSDAEFSQAFDHIKKNALSENGGDVGAEHSDIQELTKLHAERAESSWYEWIDKPDLDRKIEQLETKLKQNPEIISDYMKRKTGDNLIGQAIPNQNIEKEFSSDASYIEVAVAIERLNTGDPLDPMEQQRVQEILNDPDIDPAIVVALKEQYGNTLDEFINDDSAPVQNIPVDMSTTQTNSNFATPR